MIFTISHDRNATNDLRGLEYGVGGGGDRRIRDVSRYHRFHLNKKEIKLFKRVKNSVDE